jgi:Ca2+-binding EF-hand superfamily protein
MIRFVSLVALVAGLGTLVCSPAGEAAAPPPRRAESDTQKIVYLSEHGPIVIELHLRIDDEPFRARHRALIDKVFDNLDRNGDGTLSKAEAALAPPTTLLTSPLALLGRRVPGRPVAVAGGADKVTRADLAAHYSKTGLAPFQLSDPAAQPVPFRRPVASNAATGEELTDRLFALLDTDKDGKLSRQELAAAPAVLAALDIDDDEMVTAAELMGEASGNNVGPIFAPPVRRPRPARGPAVQVVGDGAADRPADVTLTVYLGRRPGQALMTLAVGKALPAGTQVKTTSEGATVQVGRDRLDLRVSQARALPRGLNVSARARALFRRADTNADGYLDRKEARVLSALGAPFEAVDRDGDGKISEKELVAYFEQIESFRQLAERSCVSMTVANEGKGLFGLLDTDGDGRLSVRELRNAPKLLNRLDTEGGKLSRKGVPRHHVATLALGPNAGRDPFGRVPAAPRRKDVRPGRVERGRGPLWFQKMDRNRDGDVSRREFLGTDAQFREIDTDGDGLISVEEAIAYDKRKRERRE